MAKVSAINIKDLWYDSAYGVASEADLTGTALYNMIKSVGGTAKKVDNVHQDTWSIEESEPSQDFYKNQLTGSNYREGKKTMGDVTFNFTIGQYDYITKEALMGGNKVSATAYAWKNGNVKVYTLKETPSTTDKAYSDSALTTELTIASVASGTSITIGSTTYTKSAADNETIYTGWKRARGVVNIKKLLVALTEDDVYVVLPYANITTREANTDGAIGLAVVGTALEPKSTSVSPEYWFDSTEVHA